MLRRRKKAKSRSSSLQVSAASEPTKAMRSMLVAPGVPSGTPATMMTRRPALAKPSENAIRLALAGVLGRFLPGIGAWIANLVATAVAARLSRQDEFEADRFASALMIKAGLGTEPQKALFRKLERLTGASGPGAPAWFLSHPPVQQRIAAIEALETRWRR